MTEATSSHLIGVGVSSYQQCSRKGVVSLSWRVVIYKVYKRKRTGLGDGSLTRPMTQ